MTATLGSQGAGSADTDTTLGDAAPSPPPLLLSDLATPTTSDPGSFTEGTLGRRAFAHVADVLIALMIVFGVAGAIGQSGDVSTTTQGQITSGSAYCDLIVERSDVAQCLSLGGRAVVFSATDLVIMAVAAFIFWILAMVVLQGHTGSTPGKMFAGLRVVDREGNICGTSRALTRSLLWIVDSLPALVVGWIVPVTGIIAAMTNSGYRRVGDLVAGTWVVPADLVPEIVAAASPQVVEPTHALQRAKASEPAPEPAVAPQPTVETAPPAQSEPANATEATKPLSLLAGDTFDEETNSHAAFKSEPGSRPALEPEDETPERETPPARRGPISVVSQEPEDRIEAAPVAATAEPEQAAVAPTPTYEPQWDAARNAYICWEPVRGQWLQHDVATGDWHPIS